MAIWLASLYTQLSDSGGMESVRQTYQFGPFAMDVKRRLMLKGEQVVPLTSKAFDTLLVLVENRTRVVDKEELLKRIWPDTVVEERNLAVNISTLRKALGENPQSHEYIVTIPGRGYRFVAPLNGDAADPPPGPTEAPRPRRQLNWRAILLGTGLLSAMALAFFLGRYTGIEPDRAPMRFTPFTNFSGVEGQPSLSPDGRSAAFVSDRGGNYDILVGLVSGGSFVTVTNDPNVEARPKWSPDGSKLAYARLNEWGLWDVWVIPALGGVPRRP